MIRLPARHHVVMPAILALAVLVSGCRSWEEAPVVWAPDGQHAFFIAGGALYVTDGSGTLSSPLVGVYRAAWLGDSRRLVVAYSREVNNLSALADALERERLREIIDRAEALWQQTRIPEGPMPLEDRLGAIGGTDLGREQETRAMVLYLRETYDDALRAVLGREWAEISRDYTDATVHTLAVARMEDGRLELGEALYQDLARIMRIRPAPGSQNVAFLTEAEEFFGDGDLALVGTPVDGSLPAKVVATPAGVSFDWTPDGRSLVYIDEQSGPTGAAQSRFGALFERDVLDDAGRVNPETSGARLLAYLLLDERTRVDALSDGHVLLRARPFRFPATTLPTRDQLFLINRWSEEGAAEPIAAILPDAIRDRLPAWTTYAIAREPERILVVGDRELLVLSLEGEVTARFPLPVSPSELVVGPDSTHVLVAGEGQVLELRLSDGEIRPVGDRGFGAAWKRPGEYTYFTADGERVELVVRRGSSETVLSRHWPDALLRAVKPPPVRPS
jgi:hypothetical protein